LGWNCPACGPLAPGGLRLYQPGAYNLDSLRFGPWCRVCGARALFEPPPAGASAPPESPRSRGKPPSVLLLTGSCASGKTTVSRILAERHGLAQIDGDWVLALRRAELGRSVDSLEIDADLRRMAHGVTWLGMSAVIAHVVLPGALPGYQLYFDSHRIPWRPVVLLPDRTVLLERATTRETWPRATPAFWIDTFRDALLQGSAELRACYYDNGSETPEQTAESIWRMMQSTGAP
jgi:hypothetical protein